MDSTTPLNCKEVFARLGDYVDRELSAEEMAQVTDHLARCADCTSRFDFEDSVLQCLREKLQRIAMPETLVDRILGAVARRETPSSPPD